MRSRMTKLNKWMAPVVAVASMVAVVPIGCGDDDNHAPPPSEYTGQACSAADECYPWLDGGTLSGDRVCLDRVPGGYCTHECETDSDCCGTAGECRTSHAQVCAPFESTGLKLCFLSCEQDEVQASGDVDTNETWDADRYCRTYAWKDFNCRSTGGGAENRKVCVP